MGEEDSADDPRSLLEGDRARTVRRLAALSRDCEEVVAASRDTNADDEHEGLRRVRVDALQVGARLTG